MSTYVGELTCAASEYIAGCQERKMKHNKIIYGNFFCSEEDNWRQEFVMAIDGGDCYFQVEYDVEIEKFIKLVVNGES